MLRFTFLFFTVGSESYPIEPFSLEHGVHSVHSHESKCALRGYLPTRCFRPQLTTVDLPRCPAFGKVAQNRRLKTLSWQIAVIAVIAMIAVILKTFSMTFQVTLHAWLTWLSHGRDTEAQDLGRDRNPNRKASTELRRSFRIWRLWQNRHASPREHELAIPGLL